MRKVKILVLLLGTVFTAYAQVFVENFEKATVGGELEGYNGWTASPFSEWTSGVGPKIAAGTLNYEGYPGSNAGNVVELGGDGNVVRVSVKNTGITFPDAGGAVYVAFLINVQSSTANAYRDIFSFDLSGKAQWLRGRVFARYNAKTNKVAFAVTKNSSKGDVVEAGSTNSLSLSLDGGVSHLLILKYEAVDGNTNDIITLYVNPDLTKSESRQTNKIAAADNTEAGDYKSGSDVKIGLRQRGVVAQIGGMRVGGNWKEITTEPRSKKKK